MSASEVPVEELTDFCESLARNVMKDHEKRFADRIRAVQEASNTLGNVAGRFAASVRNAWGTMDKTTLEYGIRLAQIIQDTAGSLYRTEVQTNYQDAERFNEDSVGTLNKIILTVRKYVPKLHRVLKTEMAALNSSLGKLENSVRALGKALDESPGSKIESLQRDVEWLMQRQDELLKLRTEEQERVVSLETLSGREKELLATREELTSREEFLELKLYENSLKAKEDEIKQFFHPIVKPLLKLERSPTSKESRPIDARILHNVVDTPVETIATGQSFALLELLSQLDDALIRGKLEVEERRRRRAEETIERAKSGAVDKMREEYLTIQANIQETLRQLKAKGLLDKRDEVDGLMARAREERKVLAARQMDLHRSIEELARGIFKQKGSIESQILKMTHKSIIISAG